MGLPTSAATIRSQSGLDKIGQSTSSLRERHSAGFNQDVTDSECGDRFDLERFVAAQDAGGTYDRALEELRRGRKTSHWMWFVFPQIAGLGQSEMSRRYAIASLEEARAYLAHPVLGPR